MLRKYRNKETKTIKILKYINKNNPTRREIVEKVLNKNYYSGYYSKRFADLRKKGLIDFDENYRYFLTEKGKEELCKYLINN